MDCDEKISSMSGAQSRLPAGLRNVIILTVALVVLISVDALAGEMVVSQYTGDIRHLLWHEDLVTQCNIVNKMVGDAGVTMGGYSVTKSAVYSDRFEKILGQIPEDVAALRRMVRGSEQHAIVDAVEKKADEITQILREAKKAIDDPKTDVEQLRSMHTYKTAGADAEIIQDQLKVLCGTTGPDAVTADNAPSRGRGLAVKIIGLAILNAVYAALVVFLLTRRK